MGGSVGKQKPTFFCIVWPYTCEAFYSVVSCLQTNVTDLRDEVMHIHFLLVLDLKNQLLEKKKGICTVLLLTTSFCDKGTTFQPLGAFARCV